MTLDNDWWVINGHELHAVLHRAFSGEDPELLYIELHANSEDDSQ